MGRFYLCQVESIIESFPKKGVAFCFAKLIEYVLHVYIINNDLLYSVEAFFVALDAGIFIRKSI